MKAAFKRSAISALALTALLAAQPSLASGLALSAFNRETGLTADAGKVQSTWQALKTMGTTDFLGGMLGSFKLDESSMIAGALTMGPSEFDNFLRTGQLGTSVSDIGSVLSANMTKGAGFNLSSFTGSFTQNAGGGEGLTPTAIVSSGGAMESNGACSPETAQAYAEVGKKHVEDMVSIAMSNEYGFNTMSQTAGGGKGGFAGLSCLDKLFQTSGTDILFKPPSLGNLSSQLESWSCGQAVAVAEQVGGFGIGSLDTAAFGGFFPDLSRGEAQEGNMLNKALGLDEVYGKSFAEFKGMTEKEIKEKASLASLFR